MNKQSIALKKSATRQKLKVLRGEISHLRRIEASNALLKDLRYRLASMRHILSFASFDTEINLWPLNQLLSQSGRLLLPLVRGQFIQVFNIQNIDLETSRGKYGILEPIPDRAQQVPEDKIDCILAPGLGFDSSLHRIGYGAGYYDRLLKAHPETPSWGLGFKEQQLDSPLPIDEQDCQLDKVLLY